MKQRQLLYLGGGFAVLLLVWLLFIRDTNPTTLASLPTVDVPTDKIQRLIVGYPADTIEVERQGTRWLMTRPVTAVADSSAVSRLLQQIGDMELDAPVTGDVARHSYYGIDSTAARIRATWDDESFELTVSRQGPDYQSVYVRIGEDSEIYQTRQRITVQQNADRWRDRGIMNISSAAVQSASVSRPEGTYEITRTEAGWNLDGQAADSLAVENWLRRFALFNADGFFDDIPKQVLNDTAHQIRFIYTTGTADQLNLMPHDDALAIVSSAQDPTYRLLESRLDSYFPDPSTFLSE